MRVLFLIIFVFGLLVGCMLGKQNNQNTVPVNQSELPIGFDTTGLHNFVKKQCNEPSYFHGKKLWGYI